MLRCDSRQFTNSYLGQGKILIGQSKKYDLCHHCILYILYYGESGRLFRRVGDRDRDLDLDLDLDFERSRPPSLLR